MKTIICDTKLKQLRGLMFRFKKVRAIFPAIPVHTWFVFYPIKLKWLDKNKNLIKEEIARPFSLKVFHPPKNASHLVEEPLN